MSKLSKYSSPFLLVDFVAVCSPWLTSFRTEQKSLWALELRTVKPLPKMALRCPTFGRRRIWPSRLTGRVAATSNQVNICQHNHSLKTTLIRCSGPALDHSNLEGDVCQIPWSRCQQCPAYLVSLLGNPLSQYRRLADPLQCYPHKVWVASELHGPEAPGSEANALRKRSHLHQFTAGCLHGLQECTSSHSFQGDMKIWLIWVHADIQHS